MEQYKYINICNGESPECSECNVCQDSVDCYDCENWQCRDLWAMHKCNCSSCNEYMKFIATKSAQELISELYPS